jgi:hypothetical protein
LYVDWIGVMTLPIMSFSRMIGFHLVQDGEELFSKAP